MIFTSAETAVKARNSIKHRGAIPVTSISAGQEVNKTTFMIASITLYVS